MLEFFACFPFLQLGSANTNKIKHEHPPVVCVVFDPDTNNHTRSMDYNTPETLYQYLHGNKPHKMSLRQSKILDEN